MDEIKNTYKNWMREEIESPEVQKAKEAFLLKQFGQVNPATRSTGSWSFSPSFRLALVGCLALAVLLKIGAFERPTVSTIVSSKPESMVAVTKQVDQNNIEIKKLGSEMGPTVAYQKHFSDVQITVLWVFPKGA